MLFRSTAAAGALLDVGAACFRSTAAATAPALPFGLAGWATDFGVSSFLRGVDGDGTFDDMFARVRVGERDGC